MPYILGSKWHKNGTALKNNQITLKKSIYFNKYCFDLKYILVFIGYVNKISDGKLKHWHRFFLSEGHQVKVNIFLT